MTAARSGQGSVVGRQLCAEQCTIYASEDFQRAGSQTADFDLQSQTRSREIQESSPTRILHDKNTHRASRLDKPAKILPVGLSPSHQTHAKSCVVRPTATHAPAYPTMRTPVAISDQRCTLSGFAVLYECLGRATPVWWSRMRNSSREAVRSLEGKRRHELRESMDVARRE